MRGGGGGGDISVHLRTFRLLMFSNKLFSSENSLSATIIRVSNSLDGDQARQNVRPDHVVSNCLQRSSVDDKMAAGRQRVKQQC